MSSENIEVTFKIPIPVDKPDLNGVIYIQKMQLKMLTRM